MSSENEFKKAVEDIFFYVLSWRGKYSSNHETNLSLDDAAYQIAVILKYEAIRLVYYKGVLKNVLDDIVDKRIEIKPYAKDFTTGENPILDDLDVYEKSDLLTRIPNDISLFLYLVELIGRNTTYITRTQNRDIFFINIINHIQKMCDENNYDIHPFRKEKNTADKIAEILQLYADYSFQPPCNMEITVLQIAVLLKYIAIQTAYYTEELKNALDSIIEGKIDMWNLLRKKRNSAYSRKSLSICSKKELLQGLMQDIKDCVEILTNKDTHCYCFFNFLINKEVL